MDEEQRIGATGLGSGRERWAVLTGGEPGLQLDAELIQFLREQRGWRLAVETNGSVVLPPGLDWVCVSPKTAEHALRQLTANEIKYVRGAGQALPRPRCEAPHKLLSPAFAGDALDERALAWCIRLVKENPEWRLSVQQHKTWRVR
jgi:organic radical activating enzyme